tara:strand:+ start:5106 stop:5300 length:195 start_codon:yes stop_codon:yes gene_type:complete
MFGEYQGKLRINQAQNGTSVCGSITLIAFDRVLNAFPKISRPMMLKEISDHKETFANNGIKGVK